MTKEQKDYLDELRESLGCKVSQTNMNSLIKSRIYDSLRWKYLERKLRLPVLLGIIIWTGYIWQLTNAYPQLVNPIIIQL